jgi:OOP family OmpA-OmpF porin
MGGLGVTRWVYILQETAGLTTSLADSRRRLADLVGSSNIVTERQVDNAYHFALNEEGITRFRSGPARSEGWVEHDRADPWSAATTPAAAGGLGKWLPWLLLAALLILALILFKTCSGRETVTPPATDAIEVPPVTAPTLPTVELPAPASTGLAGFLASNEPPPRRFIFDNLNYETDSARLAADARAVVTAVATTLKAYPNSRVAVIGYTDSEGDDAANLKLSQDRSASVSAALQEQGIAAARIEPSGAGEANPLASNDTEEGRAQNRRTELVVLSR